MVIAALLCFALGVLATVAALWVLMPISLRAMRPGGPVKAMAVGAFAVPLLGMLLLTHGNNPHEITDSTAAHGPAMPDNQELSNGGTWNLPPQMIPGGATAASPLPQAATAGPARAGHSVEELRTMAADDPGNARIWFALANAQRQARDYAAAAAAFEKALRIDPNNADAWADYADALASAGNRRLSGAPADAIAHALRLDARHAKALWLQASLDLEQQKYAEALKHWQALRAALPAGSPDITIVDANITEARLLIKQGPAGG